LKLPSAKKLPSGNWNVSVMIAGERISITAPTKKEAENQAAAIKSGAKAARKKTGLTVGEAIDQYVESKDAVLSPATIAGYKRIRANALQDIMDIDLDRLTPQIVQRSINMMARNKSPKTVRNAHGLLSATLAVYRPDIALRTTLPQKVRYEISIPSDDDIGAIMKACKGTENELPIMLALWLGLRMSEILGLKWEDVDGDVLHIRRLWLETKRRPYFLHIGL
jgi:integrase